jgi:hypothetical protein
MNQGYRGQHLRPRHTGRRLVVLAASVAVVAGVVAVWLYLTRNEPGRAGEGDCIQVNRATATDAEVERIGCGTSEAAYKIGKRLSSDTAVCPDGNYVEYAQRGRDSLKLCLMLNASEGDCFTEHDQRQARADCAAADFKVVKVISGKVDADECGLEAAADPRAYPLTYAEPPTTICRVAVT